MAMTPREREQQDEPGTAEEVAEQKVEAADDDGVQLTVDQLRSTHSAALGKVNGVQVTPAIVAGAYHDVKGTKEVSLKQAKARVAQWLKGDDKTFADRNPEA